MPDALRPVRRRVPPPEDPFDAVPAFDPERPDNPPPPPGTQALAPVPPPADELTVAKLREKLKAMATELLTASPARVKQLAQEIQRTRIAAALVNEAESGESDPDTYKELSMLNRMLAGEDTLDDPTGDEVRHAEAEALLASRGINPDVARRLMRVFESVSAAQETTSDVGSESRRSRPTH